jgi:ribonuclease G
MAGNHLVINVEFGETRVALIENGIITELYIERRKERSIVGNVYLGRVQRVLAGMQAAFIDIGLERSAFLHVADLIRAEDFAALVPGEDTAGTDPDSDREAPRRVSRRTPIRDVIKEGQNVLVQVSKEPIGTKGARVTSHVSLPGRHIVYMPTIDHIGISHRIGTEKERKRLRKLLESVRPQVGGIIVRTVAEGLGEEQLRADLDYLVKLWADILARREKAKAPVALYSDLDIVLRAARDLFTPDIAKVVIDDAKEFGRLKAFVEKFMPERKADLSLYDGDEPTFDAYGIEEEISRALSRKVHLPSGGYLIIDQAEALTAIDVNTGRFVGNRDLEETILRTNLEAVQEIAYQLRFRNLGGLIILDFIDMDRAGNREKVYRALNDALRTDKAKTTTVRISELGLVEMTRKRTRESLGRTLHEPCFYCDGTGQLLSKTTICHEILRQIGREKDRISGYGIVVNAHPAIAEMLGREEADAVKAAESKYRRTISVKAKPDYHLEQYDLQSKS